MDCAPTSTSTSPVYFNGFSQGEVLTNFFLFLIFAILSVQVILNLFFGIKKRYSISKDVESYTGNGKTKYKD